jgi:hypothetical protein
MAKHLIQPQIRQLAYEYVKSNFDAITAKLPRQGGASSSAP